MATNTFKVSLELPTKVISQITDGKRKIDYTLHLDKMRPDTLANLLLWKLPRGPQDTVNSLQNKLKKEGKPYESDPAKWLEETKFKGLYDKEAPWVPATRGGGGLSSVELEMVRLIAEQLADVDDTFAELDYKDRVNKARDWMLDKANAELLPAFREAAEQIVEEKAAMKAKKAALAAKLSVKLPPRKG